MTLTPRQSQVLAYLRDYRKEHGYSPTQMEIGIKLSMGKVTAHQHLNELEKKGCLRRDKHKARGIELLDCPKEAAIREAAEALHHFGSDAALAIIRTRLLAAIGGKP